MIFLSVSESVSVHGIHDLSAGRTRTVRVRYAHPHSAGFLDHYIRHLLLWANCLIRFNIFYSTLL